MKVQVVAIILSNAWKVVLFFIWNELSNISSSSELIDKNSQNYYYFLFPYLLKFNIP